MPFLPNVSFRAPRWAIETVKEADVYFDPFLVSTLFEEFASLFQSDVFIIASLNEIENGTQ